MVVGVQVQAEGAKAEAEVDLRTTVAEDVDVGWASVCLCFLKVASVPNALAGSHLLQKKKKHDPWGHTTTTTTTVSHSPFFARK